MEKKKKTEFSKSGNGMKENLKQKIGVPINAKSFYLYI